MLLAIYGLERARISWQWIAMAVAGAMYALAVKGVFALLAPVVAGLWLWSRRRRRRLAPWPGRGWRSWRCCCRLRRGATSTRIARLRTSRSSTITLAPASRSKEAPDAVAVPVGQNGQSAVVRGARAWYAMPWSLVAIAAALPSTRARLIAGPATGSRFAGRGTLCDRALVAARDTKADRYVFPAYFFGASAGFILACTRWPRVAGGPTVSTGSGRGAPRSCGWRLSEAGF